MVGDVGEHRRLHKVAGPVQLAAAAGEGRALTLAGLYQTQDLLVLLVIYLYNTHVCYSTAVTATPTTLIYIKYH